MRTLAAGTRGQQPQSHPRWIDRNQVNCRKTRLSASLRMDSRRRSGRPQPWAGWTGAICYTLPELAPLASGDHERKPERLKRERQIRARRTSTLSRRIDAAW